MTARGRSRLGGLVLLLGPVQYGVAQVLAASAWPTPYSWSQDFISDLGNTACGTFAVPHGTAYAVCSPWHALMNASFVASGVLLIAGMLLLRGWWRPTRTGRVGGVLLVVAGLGKVLTGLAPEDVDLPLHLLGALNVPVSAVGVLLVSLGWRAAHRPLSAVGVVLGVVGLVGSLLATAAQVAGPALLLGLGPGGMERLGNYPSSLWLAVVGLVALVAGPAP